jgi:hypothetical protein
MSAEATSRSHSLAAARETLRDLIDGYVRTQILRHAAPLRLADLLAAAPMTVDEIASRTHADPGILKRLLNGLAATRIVVTRDDERCRVILQNIRRAIARTAACS